MSIFDNEILTYSLDFFSILIVNFSHVCSIYAEQFEKMSNGGLHVEVSFSTFLFCQ